jgi:hypothetical protein
MMGRGGVRNDDSFGAGRRAIRIDLCVIAQELLTYPSAAERETGAETTKGPGCSYPLLQM